MAYRPYLCWPTLPLPPHFLSFSHCFLYFSFTGLLAPFTSQVNCHPKAFSLCFLFLNGFFHHLLAYLAPSLKCWFKCSPLPQVREHLFKNSTFCFSLSHCHVLFSLTTYCWHNIFVCLPFHCLSPSLRCKLPVSRSLSCPFLYSHSTQNNS